MAENESSPPFMLTTRFSLVPMSMENGRGIEAVEADTRAVGGGGEDLRAIAAVDLDGVRPGPALIEVRIVAGVPDHPVVARLAEDLVVGVATGQGVVIGSAEQEVDAAFAQERIIARLTEEHVAPRAAGQRIVPPHRRRDWTWVRPRWPH